MSSLRIILVILLLPHMASAHVVAKSLYFHTDGADSGTDEDMSRVVPTGGTASTVTISDGASDVWIENPVHPGNIVLSGNGVISITISNITGTPDVVGELGQYVGGAGGTYTPIGSQTINNASAGALNFTIAVSTTVFAGNPFAVTIRELSGGGDSFDVEFDSSSRQSRVDLDTSSHIDVSLLNTYAGAFPNTTIDTIFDTNETAYIRSYVDDPFGVADITSATLVVVDANDTTVVNQALTPLAFPFTTRNIYEYNYVTSTPYGQYDYSLTATEGSEGVVSAGLSNAFYVYDVTRVKLLGLEGVGYDGQVAVSWETSMETDNLGFNVYRSEDKSEGYSRINPAFITGLGNSLEGGKYLFIDNSPDNGRLYYYKVEDVDIRGRKTMHGPITITPREGSGAFQGDEEDYVRIASTDDPAARERLIRDTTAGEWPDGSLEIISSDENSMVIEITAPGYRIEEISTPAGPYHQIIMDGYGLTEGVGYPRLPTRGYLLALPLTGEVSLDVLDTKTGKEWVSELYPYMDPETPYTATPWDGPLTGGQEVFNTLTPRQKRLFNKLKTSGTTHQDRSSAVAGSYPEDTLIAERVFNDNSQPHLLLRFYPVRVREKKNGWSIISVKSIRARIRIKEKNPAEKELKTTQQTQFRLAAMGALKIGVSEDGIKRLGYRELLDAGLDMEKDPRKVSLYMQGKETPIYLQGEEDGTWDPEDFIEFYGVGGDSRYSDTRVYWLAYSYMRGARIPDMSARPKAGPVAADFVDVLHREENAYYFVTLPGGDDKDHWFWDFTFGGQKKDFSFTLQHLSQEGDRGWITVDIQAIAHDAESDPDHHTRIYLNNNLIGDFYWDGPYDYRFVGEIDHNLLQEGENKISIEEVSDTAELDFIYINSFDVAYYRNYVASDNRLFFTSSEAGNMEVGGFPEEEIVVYDITRPDSPTRLAGTGVEPSGDGYTLSFRSGKGLRDYAAFGRSQIEHPFIEKDSPSDLNGAPEGADYIIITHPDFLPAIRPLAIHRAGKGLKVVVADINDIYDEFSYGNFDPEAIHSYLTHAWSHLPRPQNVLLVGGGTADFKDYLKLGSTNFIPPYLIKSRSWQTASDNYYVSVEGDDNIPEMGIGRLPVWDSQTLQRLVNRIIQYETDPAPDGMENRICFVADDPDEGGDFEADIDQLIEERITPAGVSSAPVYLSRLGAENTRQEIIRQFQLGNLIIHYQGHGSVEHWAAEKIFSLNDIPSLNNPSKLPFVEAMTCLNGYFINPKRISLAEELLQSETGGAIAVWASTGFGHDQAMKYLADRFLEEVYGKNNRQLGSAINRAKINFLQYGPFYDEIDTFTLFGDPALELK